VPAPPHLALALLRRRLPDADYDAVAGDLTEIFVARMEARRPFTRLWFWTQTLLFVLFGGGAGAVPASSPADSPWRSFMTRLFSLRPARRLFRQDPGYAIAFIVTLGLGIGASTAIFSAVEGVLIRPLPYPHADRIVYMEQDTPGHDGRTLFSFVDVADYRSQSKTIDEFVEYGDWQFTMIGAGDPQLVYGGLVTANYFKVLAIRPLIGRTLTPEDNARQALPVVVLTHEFWQTAFGSDPSAVGRTIELSDVPATIVGVLEPGSHYAGTRRAQLYANYTTNAHYMGAAMQNERTHRMTDVYALVKPDVTIDNARAELHAIAGRLAAAYPAAYPAHYTVTITPWRDVLVRNARPTLLILMGAVALVLLVACANVGNLTLARLVRRDRELAVRSALGASRSDLRAQLLSEHLVLAVAGSALGVAVAWATLQMLVDYTARLTLRADAVSLNGVVLGFSLGIGLASAILFAWAPRLPAVDNTSVALTGASSGGRTTMNRGQRRTQRALVALQVAVSFVVLVGAGLLVRTFEKLQDVTPGFDASQVLSFHAPMDIPSGASAAQTQTAMDKNRAVFATLLDGLRTYPGVVSVATSSRAPFDTDQIFPWFLKAERSTLDGTTAPLQLFPLTVSADYFSTLRIPLLRGRHFGAQDRADTTAVAIVNQAMARTAFGEENPIGRHIEASMMGGSWEQPREIVGLVHDIREIGGAGGVIPTIYVPSTQSDPGPVVLIRTTGDPAAVGRDAAKVIHTMDPRRPITDVHTLEAAAAEQIAPSRLNAALFSSFALLALSISAVGIGAVLAFSVTQRTREFGIRMALGSRRDQILTGVLREGLSITGVGLAIGASAALLLAGLLQRLLFDVAAIDPRTFGGVGLLLLAVALAAAWIPARRATRVDPSVALRSS
jgi:predicted permease